MNTAKLKSAARKYLNVRKEFLAIANQTKELSGNDNVIGRIGEFIAYQMLDHQNRTPKKNESLSEKGYDLTCANNARVSVKTITAENTSKRTTRIKEPWDELIVIQLNDQYEIEKIGHLNKDQFELARKENKKWSAEPYCKLSMLNTQGLIGKYGRILSGSEIENFL